MKKIIKNDKGKVVPEKCDKCGGDVVLQIHGEPVYVCKECGKYFGTMPCNLKEDKVMKKNVVKINENTIRQIVAESFKKALKELDEGNYYGGGLPDSYFNEEPPQNYGISSKQIEQLKSMVDVLYDIANNTDGNTELLFSAADAIERYIGDNS